MSSNESDLLGDESDELFFESRSSDTYYFGAFPLCTEDSAAGVFKMMFSHQQELKPKVVNSIQCVRAQIEV